MALEAHLEPVGGQREARADARRNLRLETEGVLFQRPRGRMSPSTTCLQPGCCSKPGWICRPGRVLTINLPQAGAVEAVINVAQRPALRLRLSDGARRCCACGGAKLRRACPYGEGA